MKTILTDIRDLFDLGVAIELGDDQILVTGRDFHLTSSDIENTYVETMYSYDHSTTLTEIHADIKRKKALGSINNGQ